MEYQKRKVIDGIREGLIKCQDNRIKLMGNPYAALSYNPDHQQLNIDAEIIYEHLSAGGLL